MENRIGLAITARSSVHRDTAAAVSEVVDAFRQLRGSVVRFLRMLDETAPAGVARTTPAASFDDLLASLMRRAGTTGFGQLSELTSLADFARSANQRKDVIFEDVTSRDAVALISLAGEIREIDARLVGLCVEHALMLHRALNESTRASLPSRQGTRVGNTTPEIES
jgi:hypothetical protein